jgi:hypothetical protein
MMRARLAMLTALGLLCAAGCKRRGDATPAPAPQPGTPGGLATGLPAGWKTYTPLEGDFTVAVPGDPTLVQPQREGEQNLRLYVFRKGDAGLSVMLFERTGAATQRDKPEEIRADPQVQAGSLREVSLAGLSGLEFRRTDPQDGECACRVYRSPDGTRAVTLRVVKPGTLSQDEVKAFLESFRLLR